MHQMTQTDFEHLTVKSTLYTLKTYPRGPNLSPFCITTRGSQDTKIVKNRKCTEWPQTNLNT